jgi:hypothetical protein
LPRITRSTQIGLFVSLEIRVVCVVRGSIPAYTAAILAQDLGLGTQDIESLRTDGAIG